MLSEAYLLWQALQRAEIIPEQTHPRLKKPGKSGGPCLRVRLGQNGEVLTLEPTADDEWPGLWTIMEGNQNSFPVVRLKEPLLAVPPPSEKGAPPGPADGFWKTARQKGPAGLKGAQDALLDALDRFPIRSPSARSNDLWKRLRDLKAAELEAVCQSSSDLDPVSELAHRFRAATVDIEALRLQFASTTRQQLLSGWPEGMEAAAQLLAGSPGGSTSLQLAFDLDAQSPSIYGAKFRAMLARTLPTSDADATGKTHPAASCAFTGVPGRLLVSPFPKVRLPVLNRDFPLSSMFEEAGCNERYGLTGSLVVPVSEGTARAMQDALTYIVSAERQGKTWRGVASGRFETQGGRRIEKQDLIIAYVDGKPDLDAAVATLFGGGGAGDETGFEVAAQAVCEALEGIAQEQPDSRLNLFLIRQVSLGQAQVALSEEPSVPQVLEAARRWQRAAGNIPPIALPVRIGKGRGFEWRAPQTPYPDRVVRLLSYQWILDRTRKSPSPRVELEEVLDLMLEKTGRWERAAQHLLDLALQRTTGLLIGVFAAALRGDALERYPSSAGEAALGAASVLGILLHSLGRDKESYMNSPAFLTGRLLALADLLHREYCRHVRGGSLPSQLIGNALMPVARDSLLGALDRLGERLRIYKAWAEKFDGSEARLAKWALGQMGTVATGLADAVLPTTMGQTERAELLLGYIARLANSGSSDLAETGEGREMNQ